MRERERQRAHKRETSNREIRERHWIDIGETMERHWRDNGKTMERN
jgi:hypothetical protein